MNHSKSTIDAFPNRRQWLQGSANGLGMLGLASLLSNESIALPDLTNPLSAKPGHLEAKAKRVIQIFLEGGLSQIDTFDPKPELTKRNQSAIPGGDQVTGVNKSEELDPRSIAFGSPFQFARHGQSGLEISELFPRLAQHADEMCVVRSMHADDPSHQQAMMLMNCGDTRLVRPSMGAWVTYGLGSVNENLPGFVVLFHEGRPLKGAENWQSAFLPGIFQGTSINTQHDRIDELLPNVYNKSLRLSDLAIQNELLTSLNRLHQQSNRQQDDRLESRIRSLELAYRMQSDASEVFDLGRESEETNTLYGDSSAGRQCMLARRLAESGVRFIQAYCGSWDHHQEMESGIRDQAMGVDQAIAGLLTDLKRRGMLDDTLVVCTTEFGRTPTADANPGSAGKAKGRDHNHRGFSIWMAGGGVRGGMSYGATDDLGWAAADKPVHVHDLHATILQLMGLDHTKLTYRYAGRDFRLTDVHGNVMSEIIR